jgi:hypothetical protein
MIKYHLADFMGLSVLTDELADALTTPVLRDEMKYCVLTGATVHFLRIDRQYDQIQ